MNRERSPDPTKPTRHRFGRAAVAALVLVPPTIVVTVVLSGGKGDSGSQDPRRGVTTAATSTSRPPRKAAEAVPLRIRRLTVGAGERGAVVVTAYPHRRAPAVIFFHGWGLMRVAQYRGWVDHLAREGNTVIFPRYQLSDQSVPSQALPAALAGIRSALRKVPVKRNSVVAVGHSAGGALAADFAGIAPREGLPRPVAVMSVYPGRAILGYPGGIPAVNPALRPGLRLLVLVGAADEVVGQAPGGAQVRAATRVPPSKRRLVVVRSPSVDGHFGVLKRNRAARRNFWDRLDRLIRISRQ